MTYLGTTSAIYTYSVYLDLLMCMPHVLTTLYLNCLNLIRLYGRGGDRHLHQSYLAYLHYFILDSMAAWSFIGLTYCPIICSHYYSQIILEGSACRQNIALSEPLAGSWFLELGIWL